MFLQVCVILFTGGGACMVALRGVCNCYGRGCYGGHEWLLQGGMCGCCQGVCAVAPGGACMVAAGGHVWLLLGGMHGCSWMGGVWLLQGACMVALGGMHGYYGGHAWLLRGGMRGCSGGCVWLLLRGHAWDTMRYGNTINERAVRILLKCILV